MVWLWYTLLLNMRVIPLVTQVIALTAMLGISFTTVILFRRVLNSDFIVEKWHISRRKTIISNNSTTSSSSTGSQHSCCQQQKSTSANPTGYSADLYETMEDSFGSTKNEAVPNGTPIQNGNQTKISSQVPLPPNNTYSLRKRLNGADAVAATTAAAVNN